MKELKKVCENCNKEIPQDYQNLLCDTCYKVMETGIKDTQYQEREEVEELDLVSRIHGRFKGSGLVMPVEQRHIYTSIKDWIRTECVLKNNQYPKFIWKPKVIDIGCGCGIGTNILSQEADYTLGIDKNKESVLYAQQMFQREKNNIYWSSQVDFMEVDVSTENREFMKFDIITAIEIVEHLKNYHKLFDFIKKLSKNGTTVFMSSPNRNSDKIQKDTPRNEHHVREWTKEEFENIIKSNFGNVEILDTKLLTPKDEKETPLVAKIKI